MPTYKIAAIALASAMAHLPASADAVLPPFPLGAPTPANLYGLELNQWYVASNEVFAGTIIDGALSRSGGTVDFPTPSQLSRSADNAQHNDSKLASAFARVGPYSLGTSASAGAPLEPTATGSVAIGHAVVGYWAMLDQDTTVTFNLKLDGHLGTTGDVALGADRSGAAVTAFAFGSETGLSSANAYTMFAKAGLGAFAEGNNEDAALQELISAQPSTQLHLDVYGAQSDVNHRAVDVDTMLHVSANGTRIDCDTPISPACGRYFYMVGTFLFTGGQTGGLADFSHTLQVSSVSIGGGAAQPFLPASPVPEPASWLLMAAGMAALAALAGTRRRRG